MMYRSLLPWAVAVTAVLAAPQGGLEGLSPCITTALISAVGVAGSSCSLTDTKCLCEAPGFEDAFSAAITANCGSDEAESAKSAGAALCADAGAPLPPAGGDSDSETPSADSPDSGAPDTTAAPTAAPSEGSTGGDSMSAGGNTTTAWVNGTCHHCSEGQGPSNGTAPMPTAPAPSSAPAPTEGNSTGPKYTGAASSLAGSAFSALALALAAAVAGPLL